MQTNCCIENDSNICYSNNVICFQRAFCVGKPCSVDAGMQCTPSARRFFPLLRWYCIGASHKNSLPPFMGNKQRFVERDGFLCRWIKYLHPITTQCSCQCKAWIYRVSLYTKCTNEGKQFMSWNNGMFHSGYKIKYIKWTLYGVSTSHWYRVA